MWESIIQSVDRKKQGKKSIEENWKDIQEKAKKEWERVFGGKKR